MRRLLLLLTALLLLPGLEQARAPSSASALAAKGRKSLLATSGSGPTSRLFFADPVSLRRTGTRSLRLGFNWGDFSLSPNGSLLALSRNDAPELRLVRLPRLRFVGTMRFPRGFADLLAWPSPRTLLVLLETVPRQVLAIDPSARKVRWRRSIRGAVLDVERSKDGIVMLVAPAERIGRAYDSSSNSFPNAGRGSGLTIYGLDGTRRAHLFGRRPINSVEAHGGLAYVWLPARNGRVVVLDPSSRRLLASVTRPSVVLLVRG